MRGSVLQLDIEDVHHIGLHEILEWIVAEIAKVCDAVHAEYLNPSLDSLRARVHQGVVARAY